MERDGRTRFYTVNDNGNVVQAIYPTRMARQRDRNAQEVLARVDCRLTAVISKGAGYIAYRLANPDGMKTGKIEIPALPLHNRTERAVTQMESIMGKTGLTVLFHAPEKPEAY